MFGPSPALRGTRIDLVPTLKAGVGTFSARRRTIVRNALVTGQTALAAVLLLVTGALVKGLQRVLTLDPGFRPDHPVSMGLDPVVLRYS